MLKRQIFLLLSILAALTYCDNDSTAPSGNRAPSAPSNPVPPNNATAVDTSVTLAWQCSDPDNDSITYDVYFDTLTNPALVASNHPSNAFQLNGLRRDQVYCWKIIAKDGQGHETPGAIWAFATIARNHGVYMIGQYDPNSFLNGVSVAGNYAFLATESGLSVVDITDPGHPALTASYQSIGSAECIATSGSYAYLGCSQTPPAGGALLIINIESQANPVLAAAYDSISNAAYDICLSRNHTYIVNGWELYIIDVTTPTHPFLKGHVNRDQLAYPYSVFVLGQYAFVGDTTLEIINIADPANPLLVSSLPLPEDARGLHVVDNYAYVASYAYGMTTGNFGLQIINVTDKQNPILISHYNTPGEGRDIFISGSYAYLADGSSGLQILDVANVLAPAYEASYDTQDEARDVCVSGNYIYVADGSNGLFILEFVP